MQSYFITGTDTEVGKTYVTERLLRAAAASGYRTLGYKPVSAGCEWVDGQWANEDALALQRSASIQVPLSEVNPIAFEPPIAPHIAAQLAGTPISTHTIVEGYQRLCRYQPDVLLMEGAGGWRLPLGGQAYLSDVVVSLQLEVILVVGMRLGCLNHALLTAQAILADGLKIKGWIANQLSAEMPFYAQNLATLQEALPAPMLAQVGYQQSVGDGESGDLAKVFG